LNLSGTSELPAQKRPLSPHLQIYRPQWTSVLSIVHRGTGFIIAIGALLFAWWLWSITNGPDSYQAAHGFFNSWFGKLLLFVWTLCTFYHLCNGIRHLAWDVGYGFDLDQAWSSGKIVLGGSVVLTVLAWLL
jgi:succinate dehydrogenase / fumarate reductase cytochrome b subunit